MCVRGCTFDNKNHKLTDRTAASQHTSCKIKRGREGFQRTWRRVRPANLRWIWTPLLMNYSQSIVTVYAESWLIQSTTERCKSSV